ncbi:hypothetical protein A2380_00780 [candidate division WWE3 bacterium RIFOXYB1_FULL_43_24]|uniref:Phosphatidic acid phosphatase type 2/haloperoxidase domain-containing protein n=1 Tax=candidate division WWE3 bacterium GW2011_GWF1_42_14 TaxID=1619138 RepID=A0A0G0YRN1_UNCKA|nr:MAG: hypothetical protein UU92_C0005G0081 [candidate division WWE3 bacterium GW2011_GWA1_42_12]KKS34075.1 MAG: hypothetical protein UU97_C0015G0008 [candidate division WWE3 bacterium GW2011_GWD1_42_14]KKS39249.1 MAG: hypothetical protein UV00_C0003G0081 [candidate division WWE3 bacterium GW2011_GWF1_42_14]KKS40747.1 MAG: hypothetical protein UV03_C0003G0060 [candidate division WWE3 bacterium GW2011_GWE1_42_16]OGC59475.1 MAG: hypothetical protein A2212_01170 [candidate division WWE3 bacterium
MPGFLRIFIESASFFGNNIPVVVVVSLSFLVYFAASGYIKEAGLLVLAVLSLLYSVLLKNIFKIPRLDTYVGDPAKLGDMYRFPSSHVIFYVCFWGLLLFLSFKKDIFGDGFVAYLIRGVSIYNILFVGISRILVGAHTVQDVVAGYIFGGIYLAVLIYLSR